MRSKDTYNLYLYNDNINSFDKVVKALTRVLDWTCYQSEQCTLMAQEKDRIILKSGSYIELREQSRMLKKMGIIATLEPTTDDI